MLTRSKQNKQTIKNQSPSTFRLLDLPRELLIPIVRSYRLPIKERPDGLVIYGGEQDPERYQILRDLCLTHRDILPFAQEELFKRLDIRSDERMNKSNESFASSERCKEYAGRAESIFVGYYADADDLVDSEAFNPPELFIKGTIKSSTLNRFQNLCRLYLREALFDEVLALPNLETCFSILLKSISIDAEAAFTSVNLPNLRRLAIYRACTQPRSRGKHFDSIIPQLDHLSLCWVDETDLEHLLLLSTSLQSLHCYYDGSEHEGLAKALDQIRRIDIKELHFKWVVERKSSDNWETDFESIAKFKKVMGEKDELERLTLWFRLTYRWTPPRDVCNRALARWKAIKDELNLIGVKNGIEVVTVSCSFSAEGITVWAE